MERGSLKRKGDFEDVRSRKASKPNGGEAKMSFAERMMAKMGYKKGHGLGKSGEGMLSPVEVKIRPQNAGLGAVKEKTEQAKQEERRQAERRGEQYEDSSEEERKARLKRQAAPKSASASGTSTPSTSHWIRNPWWSQGSPLLPVIAKCALHARFTNPQSDLSKPKTKYRTAADFEAAAEGLRVPNALKSIIDATGKEHKTLTNLSGLMTPSRETPPPETEAEKLARKVRRDMEKYTEEWNKFLARKKFHTIQVQQVQQEIDEEEKELSALQEAMNAVEGLEQLTSSSQDDTAALWQSVLSRLEELNSGHAAVLDEDMPKIAVAAIHPLFKQGIVNWHPLEDPTHLVSYLERLRPLLEINRDETALTTIYDDFDTLPTRKSTTPYESLIYTLWLPKVRAIITNDWNPYQPHDLISLIEAWKPLLPPFIASGLIDDLIVKKLDKVLSSWNPKLSLKNPDANPFPHTWLFPWLPHLDEENRDPKSHSGLVAEVKRKFRVVLDSWNLHRGVIPGLKDWQDILGDTLRNSLITHLLPRLAAMLDKDLDVDPVTNDTEPLELVFKWKAFFPPKVLGQLLVAKMFPKWLATLHQWLTLPEVNYEEVGQFVAWWKEQIPDEANALPVVREQWTKGYKLINDALDINDKGENVEEKLRMPEVGTALPSTSGVSTPKASEEKKPKKKVEEEVTFKDIVEEWCEEHSLLLVPLREAHPVNGLPLFRITASANGKGGAVVFLKGDVVWARRRGERELFDPVGLGGELVQRAEAK